VKTRRRDDLAAIGARHAGALFALPWLIGLFVLTLGPVCISFLISLTRWDGLSLSDGLSWVGSANYRELLGLDGGDRLDPLAYRALANSLWYTLVSVPLVLVTSLGAAMLLNTRLRGMGVFRVAFVLPYVLGGVATMMIWSWLLNPQYGLVNEGLGWLYAVIDPVVQLLGGSGTGGWSTPDWFYSPGGCKPALVMMHVWMGGGSMLIFLAALQRVPQELRDAVAIDGGGWWQGFRHATLPFVSPAILFNLVVGVIFSMQTFDEAYLLYNRSQEDGLLFYMVRLYRVAFEPPYRIGYASAMAWVLLVVLLLMVLPAVLLGRRYVYDEIKR